MGSLAPTSRPPLDKLKKAYQPSSPIPAFFFAHGSPALLKESGNKFGGNDFEGSWNGPQASFLRDFGPFLLEAYAPKAIVVFSAHWETEADDPITIADNDAKWQSENLYYDYYNFPEECYHLRFDSKTDSKVAHRVAELLTTSDIPNKIVKNERGLDHGCFVPFKLMFDDACPVPIIEVSQYVSLESNLRLGKALDALRHEGVLILSGGLTVHTFRDLKAWSPSAADPGYRAFESGVKAAITESEGERRNSGIVEATRHPYYRKAHPTIEHFTPIAVAAGAGTSGGSLVVSDLYGAITAAFGISQS